MFWKMPFLDLVDQSLFLNWVDPPPKMRSRPGRNISLDWCVLFFDLSTDKVVERLPIEWKHIVNVDTAMIIFWNNFHKSLIDLLSWVNEIGATTTSARSATRSPTRPLQSPVVCDREIESWNLEAFG